MDFEQAADRLGLGDGRENVEAGWAESIACLPAGGVEFLRPGSVTAACAWVSLDEAGTAAACAAAERITSNPALTVLAWHATPLTILVSFMLGSSVLWRFLWV